MTGLFPNFKSCTVM